MNTSAWTAAIRIARRDALHHPGRSALIVAMVMLPVLGMTAADVLGRTAGLSIEDKVTRQIGQADAALVPSQHGAIMQDNSGTGYSAEGGSNAPPLSAAEVHVLLPRGTHVLDLAPSQQLPIQFGDRAALAETSALDYRDPLADGLVRQRSGRAPQRTDEIVLTTRLADRLAVSTGDTVRVGAHGEIARHVVGTFMWPESTTAEAVIGLPESLPIDNGFGGRLLVDLPAGTDTAALIATLNQRGVLVQTRDMLLHPLPLTKAERALRAGLITVVVGLASLEVVLLAGAAFAVSARRQRRDLALVAAAGADRRQVRSVVLASGGVLGALGGLAGVLLGVPLAVLARGPVEARGHTLFGPLDVRPLELIAILLVGTLTGILAAAWPARTAARADVVASLSGRRGIVRTPRWLTLSGAVTVIVGVAVAAYGGSTGTNTAPAAADSTGQVYLSASSPRFTVILIGAVIAEIGLILCVPAVLGAAGRVARWFPLSARLALRDVARQRSRSGPAVAAIMAALAGSVALSTYIASSNAYDEKRYTPMGRTGQAFVYLAVDPTSPHIENAVLKDVADALPTRKTATIALAQPPGCRQGCVAVNVELPVAQRCPAAPEGRQPTASELRRLRHDPRCAPSQLPQYAAVGGPDLIDAVLGHPDAGAAAALQRGLAVAFDSRYVENGHATLLVVPTGDGETRPRVVRAVSTERISGYHLPALVMPPSLLKQLGLSSAPQTFLVDTYRPPTEQEQTRARSILSAAGSPYALQVERGFHPSNTLVLIALVGVAALVTLGATVIATALAGVEAVPDLATLTAVGAAPRVRRLLAASQAGAVGGIGAVFGIGAGLVPGLALVHARQAWPMVVPWATLSLMLLVVPAVGALLAGAFTRSRLPFHTRMT